MYSSEVLDHFQNARNTGELPGANAVARVENPACGDVLELSLRVDGQVIGEARFRAQGCVATIACASRLTEMLHGLSLSDALLISRESLVESLGGLPKASHHAAQLSLDALRSALSACTDGTR
jgi:nitrogen fixation protein NifU and related proteins